MSKVQVSRIHNLTGHRDGIFILQPAAFPHQFFSGAGDGMVVLWNLQDPENGQLIARLPNSIYALHYSLKHDLLIAGHNYDGVHVIDWQNKKEIGSLQLTKAAIFDVTVFGDSILTATGDGELSKIDLQQLSVIAKTKLSDKSVRAIAVNSNTGEIAAGYSDHHIRVFDQNLNLIRSWQAHANSVFTLRYTPDMQFLLSGSRDARLKAWDVHAHYSQAAEVVAHMYAINHIDFSPDGKHFVTCSMDKSIKVWDTRDLKLLKVIDRARHAGHGTSVNRLLWTNYKNQLISASDDRSVSVWQIIF